MWEIVSAESGLDVDKLDYLKRDSMFTGVEKAGFITELIITASFIDSEGKLAFRER